MNYLSKNNKRVAGFTLIEMLVSVGLFTVVMFISTAVIFSIINGNRKSQAINTVVNNLNFSIESLIRDIKTGYWYQCEDYHSGNWPSDLNVFKANYMNQETNPGNYSCTSVSNHISFVSTLSGEPRVVEYYFEPENVNGSGKIKKTYYDPYVGARVDGALTTPDINVRQFDLYINNPPPANSTNKSSAVQPSIFLIVRGNVKTGNKDTDVSSFGVQTYISQRLLNI